MERQRRTGELYLQISHLLFAEVYKINNVQEYLINCCYLKSKHIFDVRSRQKMTDMDIVNGPPVAMHSYRAGLSALLKFLVNSVFD